MERHHQREGSRRLARHADEMQSVSGSSCLGPLTGSRCGLLQRTQFAGRGGGEARGLTTRQYARLVSEWVASIGLDPLKFGTHSLRRTKATLIYRRTGNLRAVQLLLRHQRVESTVKYLGIEIDDAIAIAEKIDV